MRSWSVKSAIDFTAGLLLTSRGHALDVLAALGAVPDGEQRAYTGACNIYLVREQCVIDGRAAGQAQKVHFDVQALGLAVFFNQLLILRHIEQQIDDAELLGNAQLPFLGMGLRQHRSGRHRCQRQHGSASAQTFEQ